MITFQAVGTVKFKAKDEHGNTRVIAMHNVVNVPQQQQSLVVVCQLPDCVPELEMPHL